MTNRKFNDMKKAIFKNSIGINILKIYKDLDNALLSEEREEFSLLDNISKKYIDWNTYFAQWTDIERLSYGIYSPYQVLFYKHFINKKNCIKYEAPFIFSIVSRIISDIQDYIDLSGGVEKSILYENNRRLLQSLFWIRETTEERERPSLEIHLPLTNIENEMPNVPIEILGKVFGRGVGVISGKELEKGFDGTGYVKGFFPSHEGAPLSQLYDLSSDPYSSLQDTISLILNRNGHITIAEKSNPILEFYDGGWHIVDFQSWYSTIDNIVNQKLGVDVIQKNEVIKKITRLAYHMATHWHSGIICIVNEDFNRQIIEPQDDKSKGELIRKTLKNGTIIDGGMKEIKNILDKNGIGRALMCAILQDGATIFNTEGDILYTSAMVIGSTDKKPIKKGLKKGGAGHRAAQALGKYGVAIKISHDGGIRIFSSSGDNWKIEGLRIH